MPRYKERFREDREDREDHGDTRRHEKRYKDRSYEEVRDHHEPKGRDRSRSRVSNSNRNERVERNDRNERIQRNDRNDRNDRNNRPNRNERGNRNEWNDKRRQSYPEVKAKNEPSPEWGSRKPKNEEEPEAKPIEKEKPNFGLSGKLTEDANMVNGVVIKYSEPQDARKPKRRWRLYPFKGEKALPTLYVHRQSAYLMGRDRKIADIPLDHPSCSKQHAVLQYRLVTFQRENGGEGKRLRPYLIDLESANGTFVNNVKLEPKKYHELLERDVLKFGFSSREYVLLHEHSRDDALDDDVSLAPTTDT
ncbi:smad nuclear interacting protein 1 [Venturia canescens]|uniref:smad nuclear interacting protein 1 n=1 Tax=Venturia canescens TaxID=32260 RepID=UPI001C9C13B1|nr:smad nuclear interacting protein 1 [Venturia canescens]